MGITTTSILPPRPPNRLNRSGHHADKMVSHTPFLAQEYKSPYGPKYSSQPNYRGITAQTLTRFGLKAGFYGGSLGLAALFFASGIPRIQTDILMKIPGMSKWYAKEVHPADNPF